MPHIHKHHLWSALSFCSLLLLCLVVAACGGASTATTSSANSAGSAPQTAAHSSDQQKNVSNTTGQQYLSKSLNITMEVKDTQRVATDLQAWLSTTDPLSTADSINYQQAGDNLYNIAMVFSVQATLYPRIESYLNNYPQLHNGRLISTNKTTQHVSSDYIDTQSSLKNLRGEQDRLLTLLSHAQVLGDILAIDSRLTDVEGQIEQIEAHLHQLDSQTSFYTITVNLQPSQAAVTPPPTAWNAGQIWQSAVAAVVAFAEVLATLLIWLAVFCVYIIPLALIVWLVQRWRRLRMQRLVPPIAPPPPSHIAS